ncbi:hypothetical protein FH972_021281 [Carpinus fangiana]|uniref:Uncharacterized protein n=1 Tax=Carpinus fangiana TaxID=176857 RepID=A0A5N6KR23_9ROSI|nr:hypothetical protein FH972_021281 [Carpinus fangiana]
MADREQPYDPYIPAGGAPAPGASAQQGGNQRTAALQAEASSEIKQKLTQPSSKSTTQSASCATTSTKSPSAASVSTRFRTRPTTWPSLRKASAAAPTASGSRCGGRT